MGEKFENLDPLDQLAIKNVVDAIPGAGIGSGNEGARDLMESLAPDALPLPQRISEIPPPEKEKTWRLRLAAGLVATTGLGVAVAPGNALADYQPKAAPKRQAPPPQNTPPAQPQNRSDAGYLIALGAVGLAAVKLARRSNHSKGAASASPDNNSYEKKLRDERQLNEWKKESQK